MQFKKLLPMLWHNNTAWKEDLETRTTVDDLGNKVLCPVAQEAVSKFREWVSDIPRLKALQFPRFIGGPIQFVAIFGDASKTGIGVVAYAITKADNGVVNSRIIYSKSSLMPKNLREKAKLEDALTIARAELIAMVCCVTMMDYLGRLTTPTSQAIRYSSSRILSLISNEYNAAKASVSPSKNAVCVKSSTEREKPQYASAQGLKIPAISPVVAAISQSSKIAWTFGRRVRIFSSSP